MQILIESSDYQLQNLGDAAMLQVAVSRLLTQWPTATLYVTTVNEKRLRELCPQVQPLTAAQRTNWELLPRVHHLQSAAISRHWWALEKRFRRRFPLLAQNWLNWRWRNKPNPPVKLTQFLQVLEQADLVVAQGGGYFSDWFERTSRIILDTLEEAILRGKPSVIVGAGLEPVTHWALKVKEAAIFPRLDLIAIRENKIGPQVLKSLGVQKYTVTGDDAIELAYHARSEALGSAIGINLRDADYADLPAAAFQTIHQVLHATARHVDAPLVPIPIHVTSDLLTLRKLLGDSADFAEDPSLFTAPLHVIHQVGKCRVVIAGSYHAAVFALSQGIPVVALAKTDYYRRKFDGLASLFGVGCTILALDDPQLVGHLRAAIQEAWESAEATRSPLLEAARQQIDNGWAFYRQIFALVEDRETRHRP